MRIAAKLTTQPAWGQTMPPAGQTNENGKICEKGVVGATGIEPVTLRV
jgi:hypothetical protein